jgi:hypothetical protein
MALLAAIAIPAIILVLIFANASERRKRRRLGLMPLVGLIQGEVSADGQAISGRLDGHRVSLALTKRRGTQWTDVETDAPRAPITFELRPQTAGEVALAAKHLAVDVSLGDPRFDNAFVVEVAPASLAARVLDQDLREQLLALAPVAVELRAGVLRLSVARAVRDVHQGGALLRAATAIATRLPDALADDQAALVAAAPRTGDPFRAQVDAASVKAAEAARSAEVASLEAVRTARQRRQAMVAVALIAVAVALGVAKALLF